MKLIHYVIATLALLVTATSATAADPMSAGVAMVDITPPIPFRMCGYFYERLSTGVKDPLYARAVVFHQGKESAALVFCDIIGAPASLATPARKKASELTGIPVEHIAVTGTHTHTGPLFFSSLSDYLHEQAVTKHGKDPYDPAPYIDELTGKIAEAVARANAAAAPVELKSGYAIEEHVSFNRRFFMKDGHVSWNPPAQSPDIVRPAGPIDPQIGIITLSKPGAKEPTSAIVSFAMHLDTTSGILYSADYVKSLDDRLKKSFGPAFTLLFGTGTCGNINHRDVSKQEQRKADTIGPILGDDVLNAIAQGAITSGGEPSLAVRSAKVVAPLQECRDDEVTEAKANMPKVGTRDLAFIPSVDACKIMDIERLKRLGNPLQLEVQAFRLDKDTAIVTLPSEIFVEFGLAIKAASPFKTTLVIELANDDVAYIPTKQAFLEGAYEVANSRVQPGTGEKLVEAAVGLLKDLK
jgi:hypothetical protein